MSETELVPFEQNDLQAQEEKPRKKLVPRRAAFVREYLKDQNATQAAIRAGYAKGSADTDGPALLRVPEIRELVDQALAERMARINMDADHVLQEMALLADSSIENYTFDDYGNVVPAEGAPAGVMRAVQSIKRSVTVDKMGNKTYTVELKMWNKMEPLKLMGKNIGLFNERVELTGKNGAPIETIQRIERVIVQAPKS